MHIVRKTNQELVMVDSMVWIAVLLLSVFLVFAYQAVVQASPKGFLLVCLFFLFAIIPIRKETVVFDAARQQAEWKRLRVFKIATGVVPFNEITGIAMEAMPSDRGSNTYRLTILTRDKPVPMSDAYGNGREHYESLRQEILDFLKLDQHGMEEPAASDDEASIRSLLMQGRKIDAIRLLRSSRNLGLAEATDQVNAIEERIKTTN